MGFLLSRLRSYLFCNWLYIIVTSLFCKGYYDIEITVWTDENVYYILD